MKLTWDEILIKFDKSKEQEILEDWVWLVGNNKAIVFITCIGDLFLKNSNEEYFWLDVGIGEFDKVADSKEEFESKLKDNDIRDDWFLTKVVLKLRASGLALKEGYLYSYKKLPILSGSYQTDNFELTLIEIHFSIIGQLQRQLKDIPDGTQVNLKIID